MICDLHTHSGYSFDADVSIEKLCWAAAVRQVRILAVTDHCDMVSGDEGYISYLSRRKERERGIEAARRSYPDLKLINGIEIGNAVDMPETAERIVRENPFDFVIGAVHFLPDGSDIYKMNYKNEDEIEQMFTQYFEQVLSLAKLGGFDSLAHLDYPLRVLNGKIKTPTIENYRGQVEQILEVLAEKQTALEINTRGCYDWQKRVGPEDWVIKRFCELGGKYVTIGSDAHTVDHVGEGFQTAAEALLKAGFSAYTIYQNRKPYQIPLI